MEFTLGKYDRKVFDALDVVGIIQKEYPDADIECLGECDFVVEYKKLEKEGTVHWIKVAVICFITMVGSGYGIIAYNNDVSTTDIFDRVYELLGASAYKATNAMEIAYAVGLFIGIVIFYDHFAGQKLSKAPTPLEVEMDKYDKDISESVIDREGGNDSGYYSYRGYVGSVYCSRTFALITSVGVINRYADVSGTSRHVSLYEECIIIGATAANAVYVLGITVRIGMTGCIIFGLISGIFIGTFLISLAETVKALPIFVHRAKAGTGLGFIVAATAAGKALGQLVYYLYMY